MAAWLFKTEPGEYSYADLVKDKRTVWSGVSNALALIHLRKAAKGDTVVVYHTGTEKRAVGLATVSRAPFADPELDDPKRVVVELKPQQALAKAVPLSVFKSDSVLRTTELVRISRLSIMPLTAAHLERLLALARS